MRRSWTRDQSPFTWDSIPLRKSGDNDQARFLKVERRGLLPVSILRKAGRIPTFPLKATVGNFPPERSDLGTSRGTNPMLRALTYS